jgi:hypothetical protein
MSKQKYEEKTSDVFLDFDNVIDIMAKRGVKKNFNSISAEIDITTVGIRKWRKKAPEVVRVIHHFLKDNMLNFEDLVKEIKPKKRGL